MKKELPLFPLGLVVFPLENLNLHIFEPRYRQLIQDVEQGAGTFGIPAYIQNQVAEYGTEVRLKAIEKVYEDGRMDIRTEGVQVFRLLSFENPWHDRLYAGGEVEMMPADGKDDPLVRQALIEKIESLFGILQIQFDLSIFDFEIFTFEIAQKIGLSLEQKYELLKIPSEQERQTFMLEHLERALPIIAEMERVKQLVRMNGHFKYFDPLNF
ncbi:MAG: LON peptidase substrate-binding domain-containing protein [Microscillaceae bacterium]